MFVFATSAVGLLVLAVLGFFASNLLTTWSTLFSFSHPEELFSTNFYNSWQGFRLIILALRFLLYLVFWNSFDANNCWWRS